MTISNVALYLSASGTAVTGTITGTYEQPGTNCSGGGIKLATSQPALGTTKEIDNGTKGSNAYLCFVSSKNVLVPKTGPEWKELHGSIWKD